MDILGPRAVPQVAFALLALALASEAIAAGCDSLNGRYQVQPARVVGDAQPLNSLSEGPNRTKLFQREEGAAKAPSTLSPTGPIARPRFKLLAAVGELKYAPGSSSIAFYDAQGVLLAKTPIEITPPWTCKDGRLSRTHIVSAGLGDTVRTIRTEQTLEKNAAGELVYVRVETSGRSPPKRGEWAYAPAR